jgi:hypothetical protein
MLKPISKEIGLLKDNVNALNLEIGFQALSTVLA